ncbi:3'(2'),5'-bisphosphate nucleotidase CysQ [Mariniflexile gromovii]|uniref:3'(2'),5'-bisphosphate nucleotidase CysQ n=2 Tax=Mariniflexile gromovii TaxID=362523 RepID=A0ABS4BVA1_9FLAO|nr:3'(2'),5'-bisphosphate nucleotidase CysQ [Mariniflexile gromovii]MBP0904507.1 3'(2'),5'-bisphosphate nucleotidase CysQ [Mariniflexile gromovii]
MNTLLITAIKGAIYAGAEIMKIYSEAFEVTLKQDNSPLTIADENANAVINAYLEKTEIPIISEENKQASFAVRKHWDTCWMVDPLDGTKEFIKRNGEFTVNIALIKNNTPVLGVIYIPVTKTLYYATVSDHKAYKCELSSHEFSANIFQNSEVIVPQKQESNPIKVVGSRSHRSEETDAFIKNLELQGKNVHLVSKGSSLKFCLMAEGKAHIYPRFAPTMEWDTAAGHAICNAVGLNVTQLNKNEALQYNKENLLNPYFIVQ